jgi:hypothetical protein
MLLGPIHFRILYTAFDLSNNIYGPRILKAKNNCEESVKKAVSRKKVGWEESPDRTLTYRNRVYVPIDRKLRDSSTCDLSSLNPSSCCKICIHSTQQLLGLELTYFQQSKRSSSLLSSTPGARVHFCQALQELKCTNLKQCRGR